MPAAPVPGDLLAAYLDHLRVERGASKNTLRAYETDIRAILADCAASRGRCNALEGLSPEAVRKYLGRERGRGRAPATLQRRLAALRGFVRFAAQQGALAKDPLRGLEAARRPKPLPRTWSPAKVARLLESIREEDPLGLRDRTLLECLYGLGARVQELCGLKMDDLRLEDGVLRLHGKGGRERWVPIPSQTGAILRRWLAEGRPQLDRRGQKEVFLSRTGLALDRHRVFRLLRARALRAGLDASQLGPHLLRHAFATHVLSGGADLRAVQELLGHADVRTTQIYTHVDADRLKAIHQRFHPRG